jgi:tetratricopeptide (TPR) repeat protein
MKRCFLLLKAISVLLLPGSAYAFDQCDKLFESPTQLKEFIYERAVNDAPVKYFERARTVVIKADTVSQRTLPFSTVENGEPVVHYPATFPPLLCRFLVANSIVIGDAHKSLFIDEAAQAASKCIEADEPFGVCVSRFAAELETRYRKDFQDLDNKGKESAYTGVKDALGQIAKHEFAHILLDHANRVMKGEIARIDAEFEADFYAMQSAAQTGEIMSLGRFFEMLAKIENHSNIVRSQAYESAECRALNITQTGDAIGYGATVLIAATAGSEVTPFLNRLAKLFKQKQNEPVSRSSDSCGRLRESVLRKSEAEINNLFELIVPYSEMLATSPGKKDKPWTRVALGAAPRAQELVLRIQARSRSYAYMTGLANRMISHLVQRIGYDGNPKNFGKLVDKVIELSQKDLIASDYGRILKVKGLIILYDSPNIPLEQRLDQAKLLLEKAVYMLPTSAEAWLNLGFIAFARGDCIKAAELTDKAIAVTQSDAMATPEEFRGRMRELIDNGRCEEESANFASTFTRQ